jgi:hypothetical protein
MKLCDLSFQGLDNRLDDTGLRFLLPARVRDFSALYNIQTGSQTHPASPPMDTGSSFSVWG